LDDHATEKRALAVLRVVLGLMLLSTFFENLSKGAYTPAGYKGVIEFYLKKGHAPAAWKAIESAAAANARVAGPMQAAAELGMGVLLILGVATRLVGLVAGLFLFSLWLSEFGAAWPWELAMYVVVAFVLAWARAGRTWGVDAVLARRIPNWRLG
jgi:uncharacterized membrane protein YphA (DoxX/SURF4 family)